MDSGVRSALKWLGAGVAMVLIAVLSVPFAFDALRASIVVGDEGATAGATEPGTTDDDGTEGTVAAVADFSVRDEAVRQAQDPLVAIGGIDGDGVVFVFPAIERPVDCLTEVVLQLSYDGDTGGVAIAVPVNLDDPTTLSDGDPLPEDLYGDSPRPAITLPDEPGTATWNIPDLYRAQMVGEVPEGAQFPVAIVPPEADSDRRVRFASTEAEAEGDRPILRWAVDPTCPGGS